MDACEDRAGKRARFASAVGIVSRIEPRLDTLPDELLLKILRAIGLRDVLVCRPHQVCRKLRGFLRATVWDELDLAPSEEEIWAAEALDGRAAFNANHMRRLKRALASLHPEAGFAAWGSARALRLRLSSVHLAWASSSCMNVEHPEMEEAYTTVALVSGLAHASPAIGSVRVEFRGPTREEAADMAEHPTIFHLGHPQDAEWPRIATLLAALGAMPSLTRLELGRDVAEPGGFFAWSELIANEGGVLPLALAPFAALEHLSLPFPLAAARLRALFDALPALRSLGAAVPLDHLRRATPLLVGNPRLERVELAIVYSGAVIDEAEESEPISPAEALEALAGPSRAARVIRALRFDCRVAAGYPPSATGAARFFEALGRLSGLEKLVIEDTGGSCWFLRHAGPLARLASLKEVTLRVHGPAEGVDCGPLAEALTSIPRLALHLEVNTKGSAEADLGRAVDLALRLRPKLRSCSISAAPSTSCAASIGALAGLQPLPGLVVKAELGCTPHGERPGLLRALAAALAPGGRLELSLGVRSEADVAPLAIVAPLGRRLRLSLVLPEHREGRDADEDEARLARSVRALRACFPRSAWRELRALP